MRQPSNRMMSGELYINGDSWSWSKDLSDPSLWCNIVGKYLDCQVINEAIGCGSNDRIVDQLDNLFLCGRQIDHVILLLTDHLRISLPAPNFGTWNIGPCVAINTHTGQTEPDLCEWFYKHGYEELDSIYRYFRTVWRLVMCCQRLNCNYKIFRAWGDETELMMIRPTTDLDQILEKFDVKGVFLDRYKLLFSEIQKKIADWNYVDLPVSSVLDKTEFDSTGHPTQSGHVKIAEFVIAHL